MIESHDKKLQYFVSTILADAKAEADTIYNEIKKEKDNFLAATNDDARNESSRITKMDEERIKADCGRRLSHVIMSNKTEMYLRREAIADEVMSDVKKKLEAFVKSTDYTSYLKDVLIKILKTFNQDAAIYLRPEDMHLIHELNNVPFQYNVTFGEGAFSLGGLTAACAVKNIRVDATFDTKINDLRSHFTKLFGINLEY